MIQCLQASLLALILNMNAIKLIMRTQSNLLTYFIFAAFALSVLITLPSFAEIQLHAKQDLAMILFVFLAVAMAELAFSGRNEYETVIKFVAGILIAYLAGMLDRKTFVLAIRMTVILAALYAVYVLARYSSVIAFVKNREKANYLTATLPMGLGLSLALVQMILTDRKKGWLFLDAGAALIMFITLTRFSARGNLLFPFVVAAALLVYTNRRNSARLILSLFGLAVLGLLVYQVLLRVGSAKLLERLTRLFNSTETETRTPMYAYYLDYIRTDFRWVTGVGFSGSESVLAAAGFTERYPHNFLLELIGEMGVFGIALLGMTAKHFLQGERRLLRDIRGERNAKSTLLVDFAIVNAGLLFYLMNYFKSYSIYDGYQLFIFFSLLIHRPRSKEGVSVC